MVEYRVAAGPIEGTEWCIIDDPPNSQRTAVVDVELPPMPDPSWAMPT